MAAFLIVLDRSLDHYPLSKVAPEELDRPARITTLASLNFSEGRVSASPVVSAADIKAAFAILDRLFLYIASEMDPRSDDEKFVFHLGYVLEAGETPEAALDERSES